MPSYRPDDRLYLMVVKLEDNSDPVVISAVPTGWTSLSSGTTAAISRSKHSLYIFWKIGSSEPATHTVNTTTDVQSKSWIVPILGAVHQAAPIAAWAASDELGTQDAVFPNVTPTYINSMVVCGIHETSEDVIYHGQSAGDTSDWIINRTPRGATPFLSGSTNIAEGNRMYFMDAPTASLITVGEEPVNDYNGSSITSVFTWSAVISPEQRPWGKVDSVSTLSVGKVGPVSEGNIGGLGAIVS